jgi:hypothetical protein
MSENLDDTIVERALNTVKTAKEIGIVLRLLGSTAIRYHCPAFTSLHKNQLKRRLTDIDFIGYAKQTLQILKLLEKLDYTTGRRTLAMAGAKRYFLYEPKIDCHVDVFLDKIEMCHTLNISKRLEIEYPTISPADLLLTKSQIVQMNEKDVKDVIVLLREHKISSNDSDSINSEYIAKLLSKDWGFYYTATTNWDKVKRMLTRYSLPREDAKDVKSKIETILAVVKSKPKTVGWKMRAAIGTKVKWYKEVEPTILE